MWQLLIGHGLFNIGRTFIGVILVVYLLQNGISVHTIAVAKALQLFASVVFNYPAGKFADKYGKKIAILCSCTFSLGYFVLMLSPSDEKVIFGEVLNGLSIAFYMGAYETWILEFKNDKENNFSLISRSAEILLFASIIASVVGAIYFHQSIYLALIFVVMAMFFYWKTPQIKRNESRLYPPFVNEVKHFFRLIDHQVVFLILFGGGMQLIYQFWSVFIAQDIGVSNHYLGYVLGLMFAGQWLCIFISRKFSLDKIPNAKPLVLANVALFAFLTFILFFYSVHFLYIVISFIVFVSLCGLANNLYFAYGCSLFTEQGNESSMVSLVDTCLRLSGAALLSLYALFGSFQSVWLWLFFPLIILSYGIMRGILYKR